MSLKVEVKTTITSTKASKPRNKRNQTPLLQVLSMCTSSISSFRKRFEKHSTYAAATVGSGLAAVSAFSGRDDSDGPDPVTVRGRRDLPLRTPIVQQWAVRVVCGVATAMSTSARSMGFD